jgi:hypothetical protein
MTILKRMHNGRLHLYVQAGAKKSKGANDGQT